MLQELHLQVNSNLCLFGNNRKKPYYFLIYQNDKNKSNFSEEATHRQIAKMHEAEFGTNRGSNNTVCTWTGSGTPHFVVVAQRIRGGTFTSLHSNAEACNPSRERERKRERERERERDRQRRRGGSLTCSLFGKDVLQDG